MHTYSVAQGKSKHVGENICMEIFFDEGAVPMMNLKFEEMRYNNAYSLVN